MKDADFRTFIKTERHKLVRYVRSMLRESADMDAEDIVHDVLARILEKADLTASLEHLAAYVYRALRNRVIDAARTRKATLSLDASMDENGLRLLDLLADIKPEVLQTLQTKEGEAELFEALETLSEIERRVIIAHEFEGTSFKVLAGMWQIPQNTLLSHKSRAMQKLKRHFVKRGDR